MGGTGLEPASPHHGCVVLNRIILTPVYAKHSTMKSFKVKSLGLLNITKHLKVILNAWHFYSIVELSVYGGMVRFCDRVVHTLVHR